MQANCEFEFTSIFFVISYSVVVQVELVNVELLLSVLLESHSVFQLSCLLYAALLDGFVTRLPE